MTCPWASLEQIDECMIRHSPKDVVEEPSKCRVSCLINTNTVPDFEDHEYEQMFKRLAGEAQVVTFEQLTAKAKMNLDMLIAADVSAAGCMNMSEFLLFMKA
jgi:hypothetical protein